MTRAVHAVPPVEAGPEQLHAQALLALGRARYDVFRRDSATAGVTLPDWTELSDAQRLAQCDGLDHFVAVVLAAGEERRHRARFLVGARDTTDGQGDSCCLASCGPWDCTRKPHTDIVHAAGADGVIVAAWEAS